MFSGTLDAASNRADFKFISAVVDDDTGDVADLTNASIVFEINPRGSGPYPWPSSAPILSATTANGKVTIVSPGYFQVLFPRSDMTNLRAGTYEVGCTVTIDGETTQLLGDVQLPVIDGVVAA